MSYDVITPSAARGIFDAIYWKPAFRWSIDCIHVLKPIRFQSLRRNEVGHKVSTASVRKVMRGGSLLELCRSAADDRQQRASTILVDVDYVIKAHITLIQKAGKDDSGTRHIDKFTRRASRGQCFHHPYLGTREFPADTELWEGAPPLHSLPDDQRDIDLGPMLLDIDYENGRASVFFHAVLRNGVMVVPPLPSHEARS